MREFYVPEENLVIIESPMGKGKTTWAINYINSMGPEQKIIFITPYLKECDRVQNSCPDKEFLQPDRRLGSGSKRLHLLKLIEDGINIVSTHALFAQIDEDIEKALKLSNYILILDEAFGVVEKYNLYPEYNHESLERDKLTRNDINLLMEDGYISVEDDYTVTWNPDKILQKYLVLKNLADRQLLYLVDDSLLLWSFPVQIFNEDIFAKIFILTFQFDHQMQYYYYEYHDISFKKYETYGRYPNYKVREKKDNSSEMEWIKEIRPLISIFSYTASKYRGRNDKGTFTETALSKNWYLKNKELIPLLRNQLNKFIQHECNARASQVMWTCFKADIDTFTSKKLSRKHFVPLNARATNVYRNKDILAYMVNRYADPFFHHFFSKKNINLNQEKMALAELLQWIWRSAIRDGKPIKIFIASERMRCLLEDYLQKGTL